MKKLLFFALFLLLNFYVFNQEITNYLVSTSGGYDQNENVSISWSLGETAISTYTNGATVIEGFQAVASFVVLPSVKEISQKFNLNIFPNPTTDYINISQKESNSNVLFVNIFDVTGKKIICDYKLNNEISIKVSDYANGIYIIVINNYTDNLSETYKFIKK